MFPCFAWSQIDTLASFDRQSLCGKILSNEKSFGSSFVINSKLYALDTIVRLDL